MTMGKAREGYALSHSERRSDAIGAVAMCAAKGGRPRLVRVPAIALHSSHGPIGPDGVAYACDRFTKTHEGTHVDSV